MPAHDHVVVLHDLSFHWPDATPVLDRISAALPRGSTGLIGRNGVGKSTLLELIAGRLRPTAGSITTSGRVDRLPQRLGIDRASSLADLLGVRAALDALRAIEAGDVDPAHFEAVGDDWDLEARAAAALGAVGLQLGPLDRSAATLSGGEAALAALVGLQLRAAPIALLDEPTNDLDADARERVHELVHGWRGTLIVVSHDEALLDRVQHIAELREGALRLHGGNHTEFRARLALEQAAAEQALTTAKQRLRTEQRHRVEAEERIAHSERQGRKDARNRKFPPIVANARRNQAEQSQGARRALHASKIDGARAAVDQAERRLRDDERIRIELPDPGLPAGRDLAVLRGADGRALTLRGPERVALTGANGVGKSTLLRQLLGGAPAGAPTADAAPDTAAPRPTAAAAVTAIGYLDQRLADLDDAATVFENVHRVAVGTPDRELRNRLARLLLPQPLAERRVGLLSGGERFRVALARLLLADPPAQLLLLDEPTNSLDLDSVDRLIEALDAYRGALIVVSHDRRFLARLRLDRVLLLDQAGRLTVVEQEDSAPA